MNDHRIELHVNFTVANGTDGGREAAEAVLHQFQYLAAHGPFGNYTTDIEVTPSTVDGDDWHWPAPIKPVTRCGFLIEHSIDVCLDRPGAYKVSKDGQSNIIGETFFDDIDAAIDDAAFEEFMTVALRPDFPHPFMYGPQGET